MSSRTIIQDYDKYLSKVDPEKGRKKAQAQEAKWAEQRKKREQEKLTEAYQKELRARTEQAARERRKVEKATAAFNASSAAHGKKSNAPDKRKLREVREGVSAIANPTTPFRSPDELMSKKYGGQNIKRDAIPVLKDTRDVINRRYGIGENPNYSNYGYAYKTHELSDEEKVKQWTNPDYKLSDKEKKEAKDILKREKERRNNVIKQGSIDAIIPGTEEYNRLQQYNDLEAKTKGEFARGALLPFLKVSNLATKGVEKLMGDSDNAQNAKAILDKQMQNAFKQDRLAAAQSPVEHGLGNFAGSTAMYTATNPIFDAIAGGLGVTSTVGKFLINQLAQNAQDLAIDTVPERQMMRDMGMSEDEINRETRKNALTNVIGNAAIPVIGKAISTAADAFKGNLPQLGDIAPKIDMDDFRQGIAKLEDINNAPEDLIPALVDARQAANDLTWNKAKDIKLPVKSNVRKADVWEQMNKAGSMEDLVKNNPYIDTTFDGQYKPNETIYAEKTDILRQVKDYMDGNFEKAQRFQLGETPEILRKYGAVEGKITLKQKDYRKLIYATKKLAKDRHPHGLGYMSIAELPEALNHPVAIMKTPRYEGSRITAFTNLINQDGEQIIVPLEIGRNGDIHIDNNMPTMFGKGEISQYIHDNADKMLYIDTTKAVPTGVNLTGDQSSGVFSPSTASVENSIPNPVDNVNLQQIEDAVQKQTAEAQKVLKEAEPIEEWTQNTLKKGMYDFPEDYSNAYNEMQQIVDQVDVTDPDLDFTSLVHDIYDVYSKYSDTPEAPEIKKLAVQMINDTDAAYKAGGWPKKLPPKEQASNNVKHLKELVSKEMTKYDLSETAQNNVNRVNTALDKLDEAINRGASIEELQPLNKEAEKAIGALHKNIPGEKELRKYGSTYFAPKSSSNVLNILDDGKANVRVDEDGYIIPSESDLMLDADGIPKRRRGVDVGQDIRTSIRENMGTGYGDDVLTSEQKISRTRLKNMPASGLYTEDELANQFTLDDAKYWTEQEKIPYEDALDYVTTRRDEALERYTQKFDNDKDARSLANSNDINGMHLLAADLSAKARQTANATERASLYAKARKVLSNLFMANHEAGRAVQANAKFSRTPEGMVQNAQGYAEHMVEEAMKKEPKLHDEISQVSRQVESWLDEMETDALSRQEIEDMISRYMKGKKQLEKRVGKGDIRKIADAIMNDRQYADVQRELEFLSTGFEDIDADTLERVQDLFEQAQGLNFNSKERVDLENEAYKMLAMKIAPKGGSFRDKLDAWRYLAMLANPTTHIKNMTGNLLFGKGMVSAKNTLGALIEEAADRVSKATGNGGIDRTKAILTPGDKGLIEAAKNDALENSYRELAGNKYFGVGSAIDDNIAAFNTQTKGGKALNKAVDTNSTALNVEDEIAVLDKYKTSLAGYLKANGADESIFDATDDASKQLLESGRAYAINQAKEAAFHQDSAVANLLSQFSKTARNSNSKAAKALGFAADVVVPFKKTPINILKSAIEYSPAEFIKVAGDIKKLSKGTIKPADFIDDISKGVTGTTALALGALLAHEGIIRIGSGKTKEEKSFDTQTHRQNVAVKVGDGYVGLSELIPAAAPFILGGTIYETMANNKGDESALNTIFSGIGAIAEGVTDMTMLSGIADTLNSVKYSEDDADMWQKLMINEGSNLASQMLPTLGRKINVTMDDTKRSTYSDKTGAMKTLDQEAKYLQTKIPGLQQAGEAMKQSSIPVLQAVGNRLALQPNIDVKGQVQASPGVAGFDNLLGRAVNNFISPVPITKDESTAYDNERRRLANATGETKVLPYIASKEANIPDVGQLTPEQWTKYRQQRGQMREDVATSMMDSDAYKTMSDVDKAEFLTDIDSFTKEYTQSLYGKELSSANQKLADVYEDGGTPALIERLEVNKELDDLDVSKTEKMYDLVEKGGTEAVKTYLDVKKKATTKNDSGNDSLKKADVMREIASLPKDQQAEIYDAFNVSKTKAEQAAYDKGGADAAIAEYQKAQRTAARKERQKQQKAKAAAAEVGMSADQMDNLQDQLASYGAINSKTTVKYYDHARQTIPSLTPKGYANKLREIGGDDRKITQKEMLAYANNKNLSQEDMTRYWNAFGEWKKQPKLVNGTWKAGK